MDYPGTNLFELGEKLKKLCQRLKFKMSTAESCTGGLIAGAITAVPGSSDFYMGGVCAYDNQIKETFLEVDRQLLARHGAVSREVAEAMACGILHRTQSQLALSTTGIAGPGGATEGKPVGTVWCGAAFQLGQQTVVESHLFQLNGTRHDIRVQAVYCSLQWVLERLEALTSPTAST